MAIPVEPENSLGATDNKFASFKPLRILLLRDDEAPNLQSAILEHIRAISALSEHIVVPFNPRKVCRGIGLNFDQYDVIIIHFSICVLWENYLPRPVREKVAAFPGLKVQFIQDEYRYVDEMVRRIDELGVHLIYSLGEGETPKLLYPEEKLPEISLRTTLTAYAPDPNSVLPPPLIQGRPIDVGYRARRLPFHLGELANEKWEIAEKFRAYADATDLTCDVTANEAERLYGDDWSRFVSNCKTLLGTESGASIADFDGSCEAAVDEYLADHPDAEYEQIKDNVLKNFEGNVNYSMLSPRIFEAAASGTVMVMYPGTYSNVLEPWKHYIVLEKDFSNFEQVKSLIGDDKYLQEMADQTFEDLIKSGKYSYTSFVRKLDSEICAEYERRFKETGQKHSQLGKLRAKIWGLKESSIHGAAIWVDRSIDNAIDYATRAGNFIAVLKGVAMTPVWRLVIAALQRQESVGGLRVWRLFVDATRFQLLLNVCRTGGFSLILTDDDETGGVSILFQGKRDTDRHIIDDRVSERPVESITFKPDANWRELPLGIRTSRYAFVGLAPLWHAHPEVVEKFMGTLN